MTRIRRAGHGVVAVATAFALACGDDEGPTGNTGSIQVTVNPATLSVQQGSSGSVTATLTRGGGFSGAVTLAVTGLPAGVTATITPTQLSGTNASATVDVTVAAAVAPGAYTATITATAQGVDQATATYQVTVTAVPDYALTVAPATLTVVAGTSGGATVNIARTNFSADVALSLLSPPAGITGAFNATPSTTNSSALVVSVAATVPAGNYALTVRGTATGPGNRDATLQLTVSPPPAGSSLVEYQFCDASAAPVFFAYQDGTGAWQAVTGSTSGGTTRFAFHLTQGHGGVMSVWRTSSSIVADALSVGRIANGRRQVTRPLGPRRGLRAGVGGAGRSRTLRRSMLVDVYETGILYASTAELVQDGSVSCAQSPPMKTVSGTVAGVPNGQFGIISLGGSDDLFIGGSSTNPVTFTVPEGLVDLVGTRMPIEGTPPNKAVVFRNLDIADGGSLPATIDFDGPASSVPATASATITGAAGEYLEIYVDLVTVNSQGVMWYDLAPSPNTTRPWAGLAPAVMVNGDVHGLYAVATPEIGASDSRVTLKYVGAVADQTVAIGPIINTPATSQVATGAYPRFRFQGAFPSEYNKGAAIDVVNEEGEGNVFFVIATSAWLTASGSAGAYDFTMPDVSGLAGFPVSARLTAGPNVVRGSAFGFTGAGIFDALPVVGNEYKSATRTATIIVP